jgi:hypothetical protein
VPPSREVVPLSPVLVYIFFIPSLIYYKGLELYR